MSTDGKPVPVDGKKVEKSLYLPSEVAVEIEARAADNARTFSAYVREQLYAAEGFVDEEASQ